MKFFKIFFVLFCFVFGFFLIKSFFFPIGQIYVYLDNVKVSTSCVSIPFEFLPYKDAVYKICFYFKGKKIILPEYTLVCKKGQKYGSSILIKDFDKFLPLFVKVKEVLPKEKIMTKKVLNTKQTEKISELFYLKQKESLTYTKTIIEEEKVKSIVESKEVSESLGIRKEAKKIPPKEEINFDILISTNEIKKEYFYNESIKFLYTFINKNSSLTHNIYLFISLKDDFGTLVSTREYNFSVLPNKKIENYIQFDVTDEIKPGDYYFEIITTLKDIKNVLISEKFKIVDLPPQIKLMEIPTIKYKLTNTLMVEVEDDTGIKNVEFIEIDNKTKQPKVYPMLFIAGDKRKRICSFTTEKINYKGIYKFYIKAEDIIGNVSKTDLFEIEITK